MTGIAPPDLLATPDDILDELVEVHRARLATGYVPTELAAAQLEVTHALFRAFFMANAKKGTTPPRELRVRRPFEDEPGPTKVTFGQLARSMIAAGKVASG